ncbi:hypothetical protein CEXT_778741 [Caerostris extrusa]|uniref:Uncharacterized protein n=1 Tax=Caerostris extrusa TaxID=172846 RepID=A0AAV4VVN5_CAEEX|nr:hypothetical protein CEXT_778741 [Caerostris extrusa]
MVCQEYNNGLSRNAMLSVAYMLIAVYLNFKNDFHGLGFVNHAIHVELLSDLTYAAAIAKLKTDMEISHNFTENAPIKLVNFVGANFYNLKVFQNH